jgi:hypothetical protein
MRIRHGPCFGKARIIRAGQQRAGRQGWVKFGKAFHHTWRNAPAEMFRAQFGRMRKPGGGD